MLISKIQKKQLKTRQDGIFLLPFGLLEWKDGFPELVTEGSCISSAEGGKDVVREGAVVSSCLLNCLVVWGYVV